MLELLILIAIFLALLFFFRKEGEHSPGITIQFPTKGDEKGIRTRTNGIILLVLASGAVMYLTFQRNEGRFYISDLIVLAGAAIVVLAASRKSKK